MFPRVWKIRSSIKSLLTNFMNVVFLGFGIKKIRCIMLNFKEDFLGIEKHIENFVVTTYVGYLSCMLGPI